MPYSAVARIEDVSALALASAGASETAKAQPGEPNNWVLMVEGRPVYFCLGVEATAVYTRDGYPPFEQERLITAISLVRARLVGQIMTNAEELPA